MGTTSPPHKSTRRPATTPHPYRIATNVPLEIKQELATGYLSKVRDALLPAIAALGGMLVPAVIYAVINVGGAGSAGWGIPMATDIAFALGVIAALGDRVPPTLKILLLALAIVDDIGAIVVIAVFYTDDLQIFWLLAAVAGLVLIVILRRRRVWYMPVYTAIGLAVWFATLESGIHVTVAEIREVSFQLRESASVAERLQDLLHPWTSYLVIPMFTLANAGVELSGGVIGDAATSPVTGGVVFGLLGGKFIGIAGAVFLATKLRIALLPDGVTPRHVAGIALLAGIGFTVSLFISGLAFDDAALAGEAKIGVLTASVLAATVGLLVLRAALPTRPEPKDLAD